MKHLVLFSLIGLVVVAVPNTWAQNSLHTAEIVVTNRSLFNIIVKLRDEEGGHICEGHILYEDSYHISTGNHSLTDDCTYDFYDEGDEFLGFEIYSDEVPGGSPVARYVWKSYSPSDDDVSFYWPVDVPIGSPTPDLEVVVQPEGTGWHVLSGPQIEVTGDWLEEVLGDHFVYPYDYWIYCALRPMGTGCSDLDTNGRPPRTVFWARVDETPELDTDNPNTPAVPRVFEFSSASNTVMQPNWVTPWDFTNQFPGGVTVHIGSGRSLIVEGSLDIKGVDIFGSVKYVAGASGNLTNVFIDPTNSALGLVAATSEDERRSEFEVGEETSSTLAVPDEFTLDQNAPNPVATETEIHFALPEAAHVTLVVYDALGREVTRLIDGEREAGLHDVRFDASGLPAGVYVYRIQADDFTQSRRLLVVR